MQRGEFITDAAIAAGTYRKQGARWLVEAGGVRPRRGRDLKGRCLTLAEREEIALGRARGDSIRTIAAVIGSVAVDGVAGAAPATPTGWVATVRRARTRWPMPGRRGRSRRSWPPTSGCVGRWRPTWPRSTPRSRSPAG